MTRLAGYRLLCGIVGIGFVVAGLVFSASFLGYHVPGGDPAIPTGPVGFYFVAFAGCALVGWGGGLIGAARGPRTGRTVGTATAFALVLCGVIRLGAWVVGDYHAWLGELPRYEAAVFLLVALAFVWLRPPHAVERAGRDRA